jgi:uncharacterized membrane protein
MRWRRALPLVFLASGTAAVVASVIGGSARFFLVLFIPVVSGSSWELGLGVLLLFLGFVSLPLVFFLGSPEDGGTRANPSGLQAPAPPAPEQVAGGLVLIGPVPILLGAWRGNPPIPYWVLALIGAVLLWLLLLFIYGFVGTTL